MPTETYDFQTAGDFTYSSSLIEVAGGLSQLLNIETPTDYTEDFNDAVGLTFGAEVEISGGTHAQLTLTNNPGQINTEDFADDTGFTYNASNTEFSGGQIQQIQKTYNHPYDEGAFYASYDTSIDGDHGYGTLTGTATGGASITSNRLDLAQNDLRYVDYDADQNADSKQVGCIRFKVTPNYSGTPATSQFYMFITENSGSTRNAIMLFHNSADGNFYIYGYNSADVLSMNTHFGLFNPTASTTYEFELNFDFTNGATRLFIDGTQAGTTKVTTFTRSAAIGLIRVGTNFSAATSNFYMEDFIYFDSVQHTANYTPASYPVQKNPTFYAGYGEDINGDWGDGTLTGTATGGASVSGGKLVLDQSDVRYVDYDANLNGDMQQQGCIRLKVTPNYTGSPTGTRAFLIICRANADRRNHIAVFHKTDGNIGIQIRDSADVIIFNPDLGVWAPTASTEYEFELNYDIDNGESRLFIDGTQFGATQTGTGTRDANIALIRVGGTYSAAASSNFSIDDVLLFDQVQHKSNYTPSWTTVRPYEYDNDVVTLPTMTYTGPGAVQQLTDWATTEAGSPRWILDDQYWSGAAWVASAGTYAQANTSADVLTNILSFPHTGVTLTIKLAFPDAVGTQSSVDNLDVECTAQEYYTTNPTIDIDTAITATVAGQGVTAWNSFTATVTESGSDTVTFTLSDDGGTTYKYWDGGAWSVSSGYAQSNSGTVVNTNIASFPTTTNGMTIRCYLHSDDGTTTPNIGNLVVNYDDYIYSTTNPTIEPTAALGSEGLTSFAATVTEPGSDTVTFTIDVGGTEYYWTGAAWSTGGSFANSNTAADINTNASTLDLSTGYNIKFVAYLHSNDGSTTPQLSNLVFEYDFYNVPETMPTPCITSGIIRDVNGDPVTGALVQVRPSRSFVPANTDAIIMRTWSTYTTGADGYFEFDLTPSTSVDNQQIYYDFKITVGTDVQEYFNITIPVQGSVDFSDLV